MKEGYYWVKTYYGGKWRIMYKSESGWNIDDSDKTLNLKDEDFQEIGTYLGKGPQ